MEEARVFVPVEGEDDCEALAPIAQLVPTHILESGAGFGAQGQFRTMELVALLQKVHSINQNMEVNLSLIRTLHLFGLVFAFLAACFNPTSKHMA